LFWTGVYNEEFNVYIKIVFLIFFFSVLIKKWWWQKNCRCNFYLWRLNDSERRMRS